MTSIEVPSRAKLFKLCFLVILVLDVSLYVDASPIYKETNKGQSSKVKPENKSSYVQERNLQDAKAPSNESIFSMDILGYGIFSLLIVVALGYLVKYVLGNGDKSTSQSPKGSSGRKAKRGSVLSKKESKTATKSETFLHEFTQPRSDPSLTTNSSMWESTNMTSSSSEEFAKAGEATSKSSSTEEQMTVKKLQLGQPIQAKPPQMKDNSVIYMSNSSVTTICKKGVQITSLKETSGKKHASSQPMPKLVNAEATILPKSETPFIPKLSVPLKVEAPEKTQFCKIFCLTKADADTLLQTETQKAVDLRVESSTVTQFTKIGVLQEKLPELPELTEDSVSSTLSLLPTSEEETIQSHLSSEVDSTSNGSNPPLQVQPKAQEFDPIDPDSNSMVIFISKQKTVIPKGKQHPQSILRKTLDTPSLDSPMTDPDEEESEDPESGDEETEVVFIKGPINQGKSVSFSRQLNVRYFEKQQK